MHCSCSDCGRGRWQLEISFVSSFCTTSAPRARVAMLLRLIRLNLMSFPRADVLACSWPPLLDSGASFNDLRRTGSPDLFWDQSAGIPSSTGVRVSTQWLRWTENLSVARALLPTRFVVSAPSSLVCSRDFLPERRFESDGTSRLRFSNCRRKNAPQTHRANLKAAKEFCTVRRRPERSKNGKCSIKGGFIRINTLESLQLETFTFR